MSDAGDGADASVCTLSTCCMVAMPSLAVLSYSVYVPVVW
jgi:hypothetical protein